MGQADPRAGFAVRPRKARAHPEAAPELGVRTSGGGEMAKVYGSSRESCPLMDSAICVTVVDETRKVPVGQVDFEIVDAAKVTHKGMTDAKDGAAKFNPFLKGPYTLRIQLKPDLKKAY